MVKVNVGSGGMKISLGEAERVDEAAQLKLPERGISSPEVQRPQHIAEVRGKKAEAPLKRRELAPPQTQEQKDHRESTQRIRDIKEELNTLKQETEANKHL